MSLRRLHDIIFDILRMNISIEFIVGGETLTQNFSTIVKCVSQYTMGHPYSFANGLVWTGGHILIIELATISYTLESRLLYNFYHIRRRKSFTNCRKVYFISLLHVKSLFRGKRFISVLLS